MPTVAKKIIDFYSSLRPPSLPAGVDLLFPQQRSEVMSVIDTFFKKFYNDCIQRHLIFGINPGRFGAGTTGVNFTAPKQLLEFCGIAHNFKPGSELSAEFIYEVIDAYGGPLKFYRDYFITSVSPLGFMKNGINLNYYDDGNLQGILRPFIIASIQSQLSIGFCTDWCICIGGDKNLKFLSSINQEYHFFAKIISLPHPRFIMQYRRKQKNTFVQQYLSVLRTVS